MIPNVTRGERMGGLLVYLTGPGRANEHEDPHLVAGDAAVMAWHDDSELNRDAALDIANSLDRARQFYGTEVTAGYVFHCSLSMSAEEGRLTDQRWGDIAADYMQAMGFTGDDGRAPCRWAAVRHGVSRNGNDHIHIVASMVRDDGTKWNDWKSKYKSQQVARVLEAKYGLHELDSLRAERGYSPAEQERARRRGEPELPRHRVARTVRACAGASADEAEFVRRARQEGLLVRPRFAAGRGDVVTGYSAAARPVAGERPVWFGGNTLGRDMALPKLRQGWVSTPQNAAEAVSEWAAAGRNRRVVSPGRETRTPGPELWERHAAEIGQLRARLAATPYADQAAWAQAARETAAAFAAWSTRIEAVPGPLADAAHRLARSAQLRRYPQRAPHPGTASARGATMILLAAGSRSDRAAYALMFRQLALTAKAVYDMHRDGHDLRTLRGLNDTMAEATRAVEASAAAQTLPRPPVRDRAATPEELRTRRPGVDEEALRARLIARRGRTGTPVPTPLTRDQQDAGVSCPAPAGQRGRNRPDIER